MTANYWIPPTKWQLVEWLAKYWPDNAAKFKRMKKKQLYAIFYTKIRKAV